MSHVKEMLLFSAGLIITVTLIIAGFTVFSKALNIGQYITEREDQKLQALKTEEIEKYNGQDVQGNKIVSYVRSIYGKVDADIKITVKDSNSKSITYVVDSSIIDELRNEESNYFINPMKKYRVTVKKDKNDSFTSITIKQI